MSKINLAEKFDLFSDHWSPRIVAELNGQQVKLAKLKGELVWHSHDHEDEMFLVVKGSMVIHLRDQTIELNEGECFVVPAGVEHCPVAEEETHVMLFEPKSTLHTGTTESEQSVAREDQPWI